MPQTIGHYTILRKLGEGGMGVVYAARDERLDRSVALKLLSKTGDETARLRLLREARIAASVNHPNICHVYDLGEHEGEVYVAMELLEGEPLSARIARERIAPGEAVDIMLAMLDALATLHRNAMMHRDLKPSNVFLSPHGIKLLDFGLAIPLGGTDPKMRLTLPGTIAGTPHYMAPEQWTLGDVSAQTDLFACGVVLYEMITGQPPFDGATFVQICNSALNDPPPQLSGTQELTSLCGVISRALAKQPSDRFASAEDMAAALRATRQPTVSISATPAPVTNVTKMIALPFRLLRADPDVDFLSMSLPDAISTSLCGIESLVVRSTRAAAKFAKEEPDLKQVATENDVDVVLLGTILRAGSQLRLATQLVDAKNGTVIWSKTMQASIDDIFALQDELTSAVVESLAIPLSNRERQQIHRDVPSSAKAYELYLRANQVGVSTISSSVLVTARDLYRSCLSEDAKFAPAWARLGRIYRVMAKYGHGGDPDENVRLAGEAFQKALALNPDLPLAHNYYTYFEIEELGRAPEAMRRLLDRVRARSADPEMYAGLVVALRFCGLLEASLAADERARRLDPKIRTSVHYTHWLRGDYANAVKYDNEEIVLMSRCVQAVSGQVSEAIAAMRALEARGLDGVEKAATAAHRSALEGNRDECLEHVKAMKQSRFRDPEGWFVFAGVLGRIGEIESGIETLRQCVEGNFSVPQALRREPWFDSLRSHPAFEEIVQLAEAKHREAKDLFVRIGGEQLLGVRV